MSITFSRERKTHPWSRRICRYSVWFIFTAYCSRFPSPLKSIRSTWNIVKAWWWKSLQKKISSPAVVGRVWSSSWILHNFPRPDFAGFCSDWSTKPASGSLAKQECNLPVERRRKQPEADFFTFEYNFSYPMIFHAIDTDVKVAVSAVFSSPVLFTFPRLTSPVEVLLHSTPL